MFVQDGLTVDKIWETTDGFLGFSARFARTGIQHYLGAQIDPQGTYKDAAGNLRFQADALYPVQRDASEVFSPRAMGSFIAKPITNDHPSQGVNRHNFQRLAKGAIGEVLRDGEYARMSGLITDAATIEDYRSGKRELSGGYQTNLVVGDGVNDKGEAFVARQTTIDGNHVALVDKGRAGPECAISDGFAICDAIPITFLDTLTKETVVPKTMLIDGFTVDVSNADTAEATIKTLITARDAASTKVAGLETQVATLTTDKATLDAEKVTLTQQLADASSPAKLIDAAKAYALVVDKAKALGVTVTDAMGQTEIVKAVVDAKLDASLRQGWTDAQYNASFASLTAGVKAEDSGVQPLGSPINVGDGASLAGAALTKANNDLNAWRVN